MPNIAEYEPYFAGIGLMSWFAKIGTERFEDLGLAGFDGGLEMAKLCLPKYQRSSCPGIEEPSLPQDERSEVHRFSMGMVDGFVYTRQVMIRKLVFLLLVSVSAWAIDVNSPTVTGIAEFTEAYQEWDGAGFKKAAATFAKAPDSLTNPYWRGVANFHRLLFLLGEPVTATNRLLSAEALEETISSLERAVLLKPDDGESHALLGTAYGLSIATNPVRTVWLGSRVLDQAKQARKLSSDNPRVLYLDGMNRFYGPSFLGGKKQGLELLLAAEKLFAMEADKPVGELEPRWGRSTCLVYIGRSYQALGKPAEAERYYRKALAVNPRDRLAQGELEKQKK